MPGDIKYFVKTEASIPFNGGFGDYTGIGKNCSFKQGSLEGMLAYKVNNSSNGIFGEFKYTSSKIFNTALESRTRVQLENTGSSVATRLAAKFSKNFGKCNIYEIAGATAKCSMDGDGLKSVTPVSLTGVGYNLSKEWSVYTEYEISKGYSISDKNWGNLSQSAYIGVKYTIPQK